MKRFQNFIAKNYFGYLVTLYFASYVTGQEVRMNSPSAISSSDVQIADYVKVFENCINILILSINIKLDKTPVVITNSINQQSKLIYTKLSVQPRKTPSLHCWAVFEFPPPRENVRSYFEEEGNNLIKSLVSPQYVILLTNSKFNLQRKIGNLTHHIGSLFGRDILILDITLDPDGIIWPTPKNRIELYYHNIYHHDSLLLVGQPSKPWYNVNCSIVEKHLCFSKLQGIRKKVRNMNKYFWRMKRIYNLEDAKLEHNLKNWYDKGSKELKMKEVSGLENIDQFVQFWLIQDANEYAHLNLSAIYTSPKIGKFGLHSYPFVIQQVQTFSFLSCHKVRPETFIMSSLISPFDLASWVCIVLTLLIVVLILTALVVPPGLNGVRVAIGICLENSVLDKLNSFQSRFPGQGDILGVHLLIGMWVVLTGTVLTNWYKTILTMEMIVPATYHTPWESLFDIEELQVLLPFNFPNPIGKIPLEYRYMYFLLQIYELFVPQNVPIG